MSVLFQIKAIATIAALVVSGLIVFCPCLAYALGRFRKQGLAFCVIAFGFLYSAANKPSGPLVQWDDYIADRGTAYATNGVTKVGVDFKWAKTSVSLPDSQPLYISKAETNSTDYVLAATTTVGAGQHSLVLSNPDSYKYYVWHEWIPPTPVHTNGVWLGTVVEPAKGSANSAEKMLIIKGKLLNDGKVIAP